MNKCNVISAVYSCQSDNTSHWQGISALSLGLFNLDKSFGVLGHIFVGMTQITEEGKGRGLLNNSTTCQIGARSLSLKHSLFWSLWESLCGCLKEVVWPARLNGKYWVWSQSLRGRLHRGQCFFFSSLKPGGGLHGALKQVEVAADMTYLVVLPTVLTLWINTLLK